MAALILNRGRSLEDRLVSDEGFRIQASEGLVLRILLQRCRKEKPAQT